MARMAEEGTRQCRQELVADPQHFARIRRTIAAHVRSWGWAEIVASTVTCATEILTNVHQHAASECVLLLEETPHGICITVSDTNVDLPQVRQPDWCSESGRGMWIISRTAHRWGARPTPKGKDVWAELRPAADAGQVVA